jgi:glycosyltransferase involved in cell wall biosynthesis
MKITCVLTSYNRPRFVRQALKGVADQTHRDFELLVYDNSSVFDIKEAVREFSFPSVRIFHQKYGPDERATRGILGINLNQAMKEATGDLFCFLCDDDYHFPGWFAAANKFLSENPANVCYGRLYYSGSAEMDLSASGRCLFVPGPLRNPQCSVDHNQIVHRRFNPPYLWPEGIEATHMVDAVYFTEMAQTHPFHAVDAPAVVKRQHSKNLQFTMTEILTGKAEGLRE